jgi:hypothetical protein
MMKITIKNERLPNGTYLAWLDKMPGLVEEGGTLDEAEIELIVSLKVKLAYDHKLDPSTIEVKTHGSGMKHVEVMIGDRGTQYQLACNHLYSV